MIQDLEDLGVLSSRYREGITNLLPWELAEVEKITDDLNEWHSSN